MTRNGGCFCGAIRFRVEGEAKDAEHCHCKHCRRAAGAAFITWAMFESSQVTFEKGAPKVYHSRKLVRRGFCPECGTQLTYEHDRHPEFIDLTVASFDDPSTFEPRKHIWCKRRLPWVKLDDGLPCHEERGTK
jgi:hypothetical protein